MFIILLCFTGYNEIIFIILLCFIRCNNAEVVLLCFIKYNNVINMKLLYPKPELAAGKQLT